MRILLDENVPVDLLPFLRSAGHAAESVNFIGWKGVKNGDLLTRARADFDLFITRDNDFDAAQLGRYVEKRAVLWENQSWPQPKRRATLLLDRLLMNENMRHTMRGPENEEEWRVYHAIRREALFENRGRFGVYNENHSDEFEKDNHPLILFDRNTPIGVIRVDIHDRVAWFRRVAVREDLQRAGHGRVLLSLAEAFAREAGCNEVRSNVAADAVGFYERCGYSRDLSTPAESESVPMQKPLV